MKSLMGALDTRPGLPSRDEFLADMARAGRPILFTRAMENWPARASWSLEWLERQHGDVMLRGRGVSIRTWVGQLRELTAKGKIEYLNVFLDEVPSLARDVVLPRYHRYERLLRSELWIGPAGTRTPVHCDFAENLFCQVVGKKRFQLYAPDAISKFRPAIDYLLYRSYKPESVAYDNDPARRGTELDTLLATEPVKPAFDFVIEAGEVLYLPYGWYHRVSGLEFSFSLSSRWTSPAMLARRLPQFAARRLRLTA